MITDRRARYFVGVTPLRSGLRLHDGRLTLLAPIGEGGAGQVWRALEGAASSAGLRAALRTREVALKFVSAAEGGPAALEREAELALRVSHPGIVKVFGRHVEGGWAILVMERCACSLHDVVAQGGPLPPADAIAVLTEVCEAMAAAHRAGVVHGDLKPQNLLLREDGTVAVGDFGIARAYLEARTRTTSAALLGSLPFMAPEQRADPRSATPASDVYALGVTLGYLVAGRPLVDPFVPEGAAGVREVLPDALAEVVLAACAWSQERRPDNAGELLERLMDARRGVEGVVTLPKGRVGWASPDAVRPAPEVRRTGRGSWGREAEAGEAEADVARVVPLWAARPMADAAEAPRAEEGPADGEAAPPRGAVLAWRARAEEAARAEAPRVEPAPASISAARAQAGSSREWTLFALAGIAAVAAVISAAGVLLRPVGDTDKSGKEAEPARPVASVGPPAIEDLPWCEDAVRSFVTHQQTGPRETVAVSTADVDGDGLMDMLFTNQLDESVTIRWGRGAEPPVDVTEVPTGRSGYPVEVADLDGDGNTDLLVSLSDDSAFALVRGLGARMFAEPERIMQGPSPKNARIVPLTEGVGALFVAGGGLYVRPITPGGAWAPHRVLGEFPDSATVSNTATGTYVATATSPPEAYRLSPNAMLYERRAHAEWPGFERLFAANVTPEAGEELYAIGADGSMARLSLTDGEQPCRMTPNGYPASVLAQLGGDRVPDVVASETCTGCTSSHLVLVGQGG